MKTYKIGRLTIEVNFTHGWQFSCGVLAGIFMAGASTFLEDGLIGLAILCFAAMLIQYMIWQAFD